MERFTQNEPTGRETETNREIVSHYLMLYDRKKNGVVVTALTMKIKTKINIDTHTLHTK